MLVFPVVVLRQLPLYTLSSSITESKPIIIPFHPQIPSNPSMESTIPFSLIILLSSLSLVSTQYTLPDHYFINCGSNSGITDSTGKNFIGDQNPTTFLVHGGAAAAENNNPPSNTPPIYRTARVFTEKSSYELQADETNTFVMVRLHFFPFSSNRFRLSDSKFEVSVSGFNLLSNFSVNTTEIKEFIVPIGSEPRFEIEFMPSVGSSFAFVNAIEAFTTPSDLFRDGTLSRISPVGKNGDVEIVTSGYAFNPVHRINVGGDMIDVTNDTLRRNWVPDDRFIFSSEPAKNSTPYGEITYRSGGATATDAPGEVYRTAKQLSNNLVNITWNFPVNSNAMYLVRAHFCDIISIGFVDQNDAFNFFVYTQHKEPISPAKKLLWLAAPFYVEMVVDSLDSRFVNISIGAVRGSNQTPFLNGVEIMELVRKSGFVDRANKKKNHRTLFIVIGCVIGGVAIVLILLLGFFIGSKYGKVKPVAAGAKSESNAVPSYGGSSYTDIKSDIIISHPSPIPNLKLNLRIPFVDILHATNNFDVNLMIGKGGFGTVYKGTLPNGEIVAVKRGGSGHGQGRPEFVTEITVFARIRHRHLVSLIGYCDEKSEMILVYEFMEKGTLQDHLYNDNGDRPKLSWNKRLEICIGAAQGLHYLHTGLEGGIIHRDVKSTNILLNRQYVAKVADFGISRFDNEDESEMSGIKGSFGYLDPEYFKCGKLTQKSDVYSFGVVLLEVLCARSALDHKLPEKEINLAEWAIKQINDGNVENIIDPFLAGTINLNSLRKFLSTAGRCLMDTGDERPNMVDVLWDLEYALKLHQVTTDKEPYEDSTINTSMQLPMSMIHRLPSRLNDDSNVDSNVNDSSALSYPSESQVFSQLNIDGAR